MTACISKSKYLHGLQCPKFLWYEYNRKQDIPGPEPAVQFAFDEGKRIGALARSLYPGGILVERDRDPNKHTARSLAAAQQRKPLFEAGFVYGNAYALADILDPVEDDKWDLIEVKSSTSAKEEHLLDAAFQKYVYEGAGLKIRRVYLMHVNKEYVRRGRIEPVKLLVKDEITKECSVLEQTIERALASMLKAIAAKDPPDIQIGQHCRSPRDCPLQDLCWDFLPETDSVFILYSGGKKSFDLMEEDILKITDIPAGTKLNYKQVIQVEAHRSGKRYVDKPALNEFLQKLKYPLHFLDFETLSTAIPLYDNIHPYNYVPFQYVLYVISEPGARPVRHSYLAPGNRDPRPEILKQLKVLIEDKGSLVAYSANFEQNCITAAAKAYPEYAKWARALSRRFVDLLVPFQQFYFYDPKQQGRASLKNVLPAITSKSYEGLEIAEGGTATALYYRSVFDKNITTEERERIRAALVKYCDLDTRGMIDVVSALIKAIV